MKNVLSLLFLLVLSLSLSAQTYDISQYRARYERRPFLELNPRLNYSGLLTDQTNEDQHRGGAGIDFLWREQSNLDERIRDWSLSGQANFSREEFEDPDRFDQSRKQAFLSGSMSQTHYSANNKFWGFRGSALVNLQDQDNEIQVSNRSTNINIQPGLFFGGGRIEFSEDALLANWMMDDLLEAGTIRSATPEQRYALAQRVTSIIGNRTFDFRRRRIYELQQLQQLFQEVGITVEDDFMLFAMLNDNWAFANRATLPNGQRWTVGLDGGGNYFYRSLPVATDNFLVFAQPYVNFQSAKIRHNNASTILFAELRAFYQNNLDEGNGQSPTIDLTSQSGGALALGHSYVWLPISRTTLRWDNSVSIAFTNFDAENPFFLDDQWNTQLQSALTWDYFISYTWRLSLNAGIRASFIDSGFNAAQVIQPFLNLQTNIAIF